MAAGSPVASAITAQSARASSRRRSSGIAARKASTSASVGLIAGMASSSQLVEQPAGADDLRAELADAAGEVGVGGDHAQRPGASWAAT